MFLRRKSGGTFPAAVCIVKNWKKYSRVELLYGKNWASAHAEPVSYEKFELFLELD